MNVGYLRRFSEVVATFVGYFRRFSEAIDYSELIGDEEDETDTFTEKYIFHSLEFKLWWFWMIVE